MKTRICKCFQCRATRKRTRKRNRVQTMQVRSARHRVKQMIHAGKFDILPESVVVDYYS